MGLSGLNSRPSVLVLAFSALLIIAATQTTQGFPQLPEGVVIGIVSIPSAINGYPPQNYSYFPSSYVKFVESGGAQVVPIQYDLPKANITYLLNKLNGVFFTGGDASYFDSTGGFTAVATTIQYIIDYAIQMNQKGIYYPVWGTCEGFEAIGMILANNFSIRSSCVGCEDIDKNNFVNLAYQSRLLAQMDPDLIDLMSYANISYFAQQHMFGVPLFQPNGSLSGVLQPVTFTFDQDNTKYVSSFESPIMPIYGTQFHQEKSTYEWHALNHYNHDYNAVRLQQYFSDFFVNETRQNTNTFPGYSQFTIDNYQAKVVAGSGYTSVYLFPARAYLLTPSGNSTSPIGNLPYEPPQPPKFSSYYSITGVLAIFIIFVC